MNNPTGEPDETISALAEVAAEVAGATKGTNDAGRLLRQKLEAIGRISSVIQSVAGQAKLLALNASIEAARSGAEGRGFSVVAAEMKSLATQADAGAREINACLGEALDAASVNDAAAAALTTAVERGLGIVGKMVTASELPTQN